MRVLQEALRLNRKLGTCYGIGNAAMMKVIVDRRFCLMGERAVVLDSPRSARSKAESALRTVQG